MGVLKQAADAAKQVTEKAKQVVGGLPTDIESADALIQQRHDEVLAVGNDVDQLERDYEAAILNHGADSGEATRVEKRLATRKNDLQRALIAHSGAKAHKRNLIEVTAAAEQATMQQDARDLIAERAKLAAQIDKQAAALGKTVAQLQTVHEHMRVLQNKRYLPSGLSFTPNRADTFVRQALEAAGVVPAEERQFALAYGQKSAKDIVDYDNQTALMHVGEVAEAEAA